MAVILITGVGLISTHLGVVLKKNGHEVRYLSQNPSKHKNLIVFKWHIQDSYIDKLALKSVTHIIHLAGANIITKRWTQKRKNEIIESRVNTTTLLFNSIKKTNNSLKHFIATSATGFYGLSNSTEVFSEKSNSSNDFISIVCQKWEIAINQFNTLNIPTTILRTGVVFSQKGGAFINLIKPIKLGFGAILGNGEQYIPWIHIDDLCAIYTAAIESTNFVGTFNAVAPEHITNSKITKTLAKKLNKALWLPNIPKFILNLFFGQRSILLLSGSAVSSNKLIKTGFGFKYPTFKEALNHLLQK